MNCKECLTQLSKSDKCAPEIKYSVVIYSEHLTCLYMQVSVKNFQNNNNIHGT